MIAFQCRSVWNVILLSLGFRIFFAILFLLDDSGKLVKFNMTELTSYICLQGIKYGNVTLTITGEVDGTPFEGEDTVKVLLLGDLDHDGDVDSADFIIFCGYYGKKL